MTTTPDARPLTDRLTEHTTHLRAKRLPTQDDRTSLQLLEELGLKHCQDTTVTVNRQALTMILTCLKEGAYDPYWEQAYPTGYLFHAVNELSLNLEGSSDDSTAQVLEEIRQEARHGVSPTPIKVPSDQTMTPCANCGKPWSQAKEHRTEQMYDGEWVCSQACEDEHAELGCPFEHGENYRVQFELREPAQEARHGD